MAAPPARLLEGTLTLYERSEEPPRLRYAQVCHAIATAEALFLAPPGYSVTTAHLLDPTGGSSATHPLLYPLAPAHVACGAAAVAAALGGDGSVAALRLPPQRLFALHDGQHEPLVLCADTAGEAAAWCATLARAAAAAAARAPPPLLPPPLQQQQQQRVFDPVRAAQQHLRALGEPPRPPHPSFTAHLAGLDAALEARLRRLRDPAHLFASPVAAWVLLVRAARLLEAAGSSSGSGVGEIRGGGAGSNGAAATATLRCAA